jgi:hypothetical protein
MKLRLTGVFFLALFFSSHSIAMDAWPPNYGALLEYVRLLSAPAPAQHVGVAAQGELTVNYRPLLYASAATHILTLFIYNFSIPRDLPPFAEVGFEVGPSNIALLDGSTSYARGENNRIVSYAWTVNGKKLHHDTDKVEAPFIPESVNRVTLTVTDANGLSDTLNCIFAPLNGLWISEGCSR